MKWLKFLTIALVLLYVGSATVLIVLSSVNSKYKGEIEGTEFIIQEYFGAGNNRYDVDDYGNIYFAGFKGSYGFVLVYDSNGEYLYTIKIPTSGSVGVIIDDENNILVYVTRQHKIIHYSNDGTLDYIEENVPNGYIDFLPSSSDRTRTRDGINYTNKNRTIIREENGVETIVFTVPVWQKWYRAFKLTLIFSGIGLFFRIGIPLWAKRSKEMKKTSKTEREGGKKEKLKGKDNK